MTGIIARLLNERPDSECKKLPFEAVLKMKDSQIDVLVQLLKKEEGKSKCLESQAANKPRKF